MEKKPKITETNFEEQWLEKFTYEDTVFLNKATADNSKIEQESLAQTANRKREMGIKIRIPKRDFLDKTNASQILSKWEGIVYCIRGNIFLGKLRDLTSVKGFISEAEFSINDLRDDDKELLAIGAVFYWYIGYMTISDGIRIKASVLKFQRLPRWQKNKIKEIKEKARILRDKLKWI